MSNVNNGTPFRKQTLFSPSSRPSTSALGNSTDGIAQPNDLNSIIPSSDSLSRSFSASIKRPCSSVKQLDLTQFANCDQDLHSNHVSKRLRPSVDAASLSRSTLNDSLRRSTNEPLSLQRPSSRLSISTASSTSTTPALYKNPKFLFTSQRLSTPDRLFEAKQALDTSSTSGSVYGQSNSRFFDGKTLFGSASTRKNIRRLGTTPYAISNIRTIEAKPLNRHSVAFSALNSDTHLSSVTQRILENLEKAATPIQDAKRRYSYQPQTVERPTAASAHASKLFDSPTPSVQNNGRCNVDFSYKPLKYILTPSVTNESGSENEAEIATTVPSTILNKDFEKLKEIKRAEKALETLKQTSESTLYQPRKDQTFGKITKRDLEKGRKAIDSNAESDNAHLDALATLKPLTVPISSLKPFTFSEKESSQPDKSLNDNTADKKTTNALFQFSSPTSFGPSTTVNSNASLSINFSSPINASNNAAVISTKPKPLESGTWDEQFKSKGKDWNLAASTETVKDVAEVDGSCLSKKITDSPSAPKVGTNISLFETLKQKKQSNTWSCPTCCVDNESSADQCVACEEPNPNKKKSESTSVPPTDAQPGFKFGSFAPPSVISSSVTNSQTSLNELFKKKSSNWTCSICMVSNDMEEAACISCEEPNPNKKKESSSTNAAAPLFKFGDFAKPSPTTTSQPAETLKVPNDIKSCSTVNKWTCFYCKAANDEDSQKCVECQKVKTLAATKDEVQKFYGSQTFTFGFNNPTLVATSKANSDNLISTETFKFEAPALAAPTSPRQSQPCDASNQLKPAEAPPSSEVVPISKPDVPEIPVAVAPFKIASKLPEVNNLISGENNKLPSATLNESNETGDKQSKNLFQFGSESATPASSLFKFGSATAPKTAETKSATSSNVATISTPLFNFGSKSALSNIETQPIVPSLATTTVPSFKLPSPPTTSTTAATTIPKISFATENGPSSLSTLPTTTASSNMFVFGSKSTSASTAAEPAKPTFNNNLFTLSSSSKLATAPVVTSTTAPTTGLFQFGSSSANKPATDSPFSFAAASTTTTTSTIPSSFSFSAPAPTSTTTTTTIASATTTPSITSIPTKFSFGAPVSFPKIDVGSPLNVNSTKVNINFSQPSTTSTSTGSGLFTFGSSQNSTAANAITPAFGGTQSADKPGLMFPGSNSSLPSQNTGNLFAPSSVPTFNFAANANSTTSNPNSSSLFSFGAKSNESQPTFSFNQTATPVATGPAAGSGGYNFGAAMNQNPPAFGSMFGANASQQPVASFESFSAPQTNSSFKFNADPTRATFAPPPFANNNNNNNNAVDSNQNNPFQFMADAQAANRQIKKAKRRLK